MKPLYISLYFDEHGDKYKQQAIKLKKLYLKLGITDFEISNEIKNVREHLKLSRPDNTSVRAWKFRYIPFFIEAMLNKYSRPMLYIHCDSLINRKLPETFWNNLNVGYSEGKNLGGKRIILASPIYINYSLIGLNFIKAWQHKCLNLPGKASEHGLFIKTIQDSKLSFSSQPFVRPISKDCSSRNFKDQTYFNF